MKKSDVAKSKIDGLDSKHVQETKAKDSDHEMEGRHPEYQSMLSCQFFEEEKEQKLDSIAESSEVVDENNMKKSDVANIKSKIDGLDSKHVQETKAKDSDHVIGGRHPEYHSMLSRQLSPSPASSEASSTMDEVAELPNLRRLRGHTISVVNPATKRVGASPVGHCGSGNEPTRVGVPPSFVFLQLYHSGALQAGGENLYWCLVIRQQKEVLNC